jgi:hypothetical protein
MSRLVTNKPLTYEIPDHLVDVEADADDIECEDECYERDDDCYVDAYDSQSLGAP